jgi:hypothetical protein
LWNGLHRTDYIASDATVSRISVHSKVQLKDDRVRSVGTYGYGLLSDEDQHEAQSSALATGSTCLQAHAALVTHRGSRLGDLAIDFDGPRKSM